MGGAARYAELRRQARREVVLDELRLFHVAVSRAERELLVTAADDATTRPSDLCALVARAAGDALVRTPSVGAARRAGRAVPELGAGATLVEVTAVLRREAVTGEPGTARREAATRPAGPAGRRGGPRRRPEGVGVGALPAPGSAARARPRCTCRPSAVEKFLRCPLQWYLTSTGGDRPRETAQGVGTLVHAALEAVPDADVDGLRAAVEHGWGDLELGSGWVSAHQRARVEEMLRKLGAWAAQQRSAGTRVLASEVPFVYEVDGITVRGTIDRVERTAAGGVRVVDLKTGRTVVSAAEAVDNPQLQLYQLAVAAGAVDGVEGHPAGGLLLYVGGPQRTARERVQPAPDAAALEAVRDRVRQVGAGMRGGEFVARTSEACQRCPVRSSCPTTAEGRRTPSPLGVPTVPSDRPGPSAPAPGGGS